MRTWTVAAPSKSNDWRIDIYEYFDKKSDAMKYAKHLAKTQPDLYQSISVYADNGGEIIDETYVYILKTITK